MSNQVTFHYLGSVGYISKGIFNWVFQLRNQLDLIWDINLLSVIHILRYLSTHQTNRTSSFGSPIHTSDQPNKLIWTPITEENPLSEQEWKHIWKLKILHERFKKLLWKIALELDALPSKKCPKQEMASR